MLPVKKIELPDEETELTDEQLELGGFRFEDLKEKRIVSSRTDLLRKQTDLGFPRAVKTGANQAIFLKVEVYAWMRERIAQRDAPPLALPDGGKRRVGRPPNVERVPGVRFKPKPKMKRAAAEARENAGADAG